jgi:hypothetical protein
MSLSLLTSGTLSPLFAAPIASSAGGRVNVPEEQVAEEGELDTEEMVGSKGIGSVSGQNTVS